MFWKRDLGNVDLSGLGGKQLPPKPKIGPVFERFLVWFGVILPALAILFESEFHFCARKFFDPFPSNTHMLLFAIVPFAGFLSWLSLSRNQESHLGLSLFLNGMAVGIAILYTLMFLPLMPGSLAAIMLFGLGLLGLAPFFSLISLFFTGKKLASVASEAGTAFHPHQVKHAGHLVVLALVLAVELPSTLTRVALSMACEENPATKAQGLSLLRSFGNHEVMLRACYERSGRATDVLGSLYEVSHPPDVELMRSIFYKATGRTFNSFPIPDSARATMRHMGTLAYDGVDQSESDEFDMDPDIAGEVVSGVSRGLFVSKSLIDAKVDADACVSKLSWHLDFSNKSKYDREVRARVRLPHGASVNHACLIVNGKEYPCRITVKEEARAIYQAAVESKQNPLLVSSCGEDTVLVQCFPAPPGDKIQLHFEAVAPLALDRQQQAVLSLPQFEERNFQINVPHSLSIESNHELSTKWGQFKTEKTKAGNFLLTGSIDGGELATGSGIINFKRGNQNSFYCIDRTITGLAFRSRGPALIQENTGKYMPSAPKRLAVFVDLSSPMKEHLKQVTEALKNLPSDMQVAVYCAGDRGSENLSAAKYLSVSSAEFQSCLKKLAEKECVGGQTDYGVYDLLASSHAGDALLWIHGAQPMSAGGYELSNLLNLPYWRTGRLYDMQLVSGPNQFLDGVRSSFLTKVPRFGTVSEDLNFLFDEWRKPGSMLAMRIEQIYPFYMPAAQAQNTAHKCASSGEIAEPLPYNGPAPVSTRDNCGPLAASSASPACFAGAAPGCAPAEIACSEEAAPIARGCGLIDENPGLPTAQGRETMKELVQVWASEQINSYLNSGNEAAALSLARRYSLVTPVSSAVLADTVPELERMSCPAPLREPSTHDCLMRFIDQCFEGVMAAIGARPYEMTCCKGGAAGGSNSPYSGPLEPQVISEGCDESGAGCGVSGVAMPCEGNAPPDEGTEGGGYGVGGDDQAGGEGEGDGDPGSGSGFGTIGGEISAVTVKPTSQVVDKISQFKQLPKSERNSIDKESIDMGAMLEKSRAFAARKNPLPSPIPMPATAPAPAPKISLAEPFVVDSIHVSGKTKDISGSYKKEREATVYGVTRTGVTRTGEKKAQAQWRAAPLNKGDNLAGAKEYRSPALPACSYSGSVARANQAQQAQFDAPVPRSEGQSTASAAGRPAACCLPPPAAFSNGQVADGNYQNQVCQEQIAPDLQTDMDCCDEEAPAACCPPGSPANNPSPATNHQQAKNQEQEESLYLDNGEINIPVMLKKFWLMLLGMFALIFSLVHKTFQKLGLEKEPGLRD